MEPTDGLLGGTTPEDRQAPAGGGQRPGQLVRLLEGAVDRGLHERTRYAPPHQFPAQALAAERTIARPGLRPGSGEGPIVDIATCLELRHDGFGHVGRRTAAAEAAGEVAARPGPPSE
jgi:hypothetical protein